MEIPLAGRGEIARRWGSREVNKIGPGIRIDAWAVIATINLFRSFVHLPLTGVLGAGTREAGERRSGRPRDGQACFSGITCPGIRSLFFTDRLLFTLLLSVYTRVSE